MKKLICLCLLMACSVSQAASITITNPGFESPVLSDGALDWGVYPFGYEVGGWTTAGGVGSAAGIYNPTTTDFSGGAYGGENVGVLVSYNTAWLIQTLGTTYEEGKTYTLTAMVGDSDNHDLKDFGIGLFVAGSIKSTGGTTPVPADDGWSQVTATVVADASMDGQAIEVRLYSFSGILVDDPDSTNFGVFVDDVQLTVVPIPAAFWLFGSSLLGLGWMRRKA